MSDKQKIAMFIDADNAPASKIDLILTELAKYGVVNIRKAYGNWKSDRLKSWEKQLHEYAIVPVQQFDLVKGKNASDIALVIDVMDVLYTKGVDVICLVSSDCDFTPLVTRALAEGKVVIGFGEDKTPKPFRNCCSLFLQLEELEELEDEGRSQKAAPRNLKSDTKLINLLRKAVEAVEEEDGWANLGEVGQHISNHASFDSRNYGFKKLSDLYKATGLFEVKSGPGNGIRVRSQKKSRAAGRPASQAAPTAI